MKRKQIIVDLFCGAGGMTTGAKRALSKLDLPAKVYCLNHWRVAIDTHSLNHPDAVHVCQDIATARPHLIVPEGYVDLLLGAPTCTHHSLARGGKPTSDQQRADPWHLIPWFTELRVKRAIIENVWEYTKWGPVDPRTSRPIKKREAEYFEAWKETIRRIGATSIEHRKLNSANYGGATTRQRMIMKIRFDRVSIGWAPITHHKHQPGRLELFPTMKPWRPAREIIDWSIKGKSIFGRPVPLAPKTLGRILAGAIKFDWPQVLRVKIARELERSLRHHMSRAFSMRHAKKAKLRNLARKKFGEYLGWLRHIQASPNVDAHASPGKTPAPMVVVLRRNADGRSTAEPLPALAAGGQHIGLAEPIILNRHGDNGGYDRTTSVDEPAPTPTTSGAGYLVQPFVLSQGAGGAPRSVSEPLPTAPGGGAHALIAPYYGCGSGTTCVSSDDPLPTVTSVARFAMVIPITHSDGSSRARDIDVDPLPTLTTANRGELAFITAQFGEREGQQPRVHDIAEPAPVICATGHINLVEADGIDCLYRMFVVDELAAAMGFSNGDMKYQFVGTKTEQIKQVGNAVSVEMMEAEVSAFMSDAVKPAGMRKTAERRAIA